MTSIHNPLHFTEALPNPLHTNPTTRVFVTREILPRPNDPLIGTIITPDKTAHDSAAFWFGVDGRGVEGHVISPVNAGPRTVDGDDVIVLFGEGKWGVGRYLSTVSTTNRAVVTDIIRNDGVRFPVGMNIPASAWVPAAPWARELMPLEGEPVDVTEARASVAERRWLLRRAHGVVLREARTRNWYEDYLNGAEDAGLTVPHGVWNPAIEGEMITHVRLDGGVDVETLNNYQKERVGMIAGKSRKPSKTQAAVTVEVLLLDPEPFDPDDNTYGYAKANQRAQQITGMGATLSTTYLVHTILTSLNPAA